MVAQELGHLLDCETSEIDPVNIIPYPRDTDSLGLVFPVHAWGLPLVLERFVPWLPQIDYLWVVMTCGDDIGFADKVLDHILDRFGNRPADAVYSVAMPNTYVCLPGFDIDTPDVASAKVRATAEKLRTIAGNIRERVCERKVVRGAFPLTKTCLLRPLFKKFLITDRPFHVDKTRCTECGLCAKTCPMQNISLSSEGPNWHQRECVGCLRCYHQCPAHAIEWGRTTRGKGHHIMDLHTWQQAISPSGADGKNNR